MSNLVTTIPGLRSKPTLTPGRLLAWAVLILMIGITLAPLWVVIKT